MRYVRCSVPENDVHLLPPDIQFHSVGSHTRNNESSLSQSQSDLEGCVSLASPSYLEADRVNRHRGVHLAISKFTMNYPALSPEEMYARPGKIINKDIVVSELKKL